MHMESPERFCSSATGNNSMGSFTAGTRNVPSPVEPCGSHVLACMDSPQEVKTQERKARTLPGWERHWTSSLSSWIECYLHLPVVAVMYFNVTLTHQAWAMNAPQISRRWNPNVTSFDYPDSQVSWGGDGEKLAPFPHSCCCEHVQRHYTEILGNPPRENTGISGFWVLWGQIGV